VHDVLVNKTVEVTLADIREGRNKEGLRELTKNLKKTYRSLFQITHEMVWKKRCKVNWPSSRIRARKRFSKCFV